MDQRLFRVRRNGMMYEIVECIIYDAGYEKVSQEVIFYTTDKYLCDKEAERLNKEVGA